MVSFIHIFNDAWIQYTAVAGQTRFPYDFHIKDSTHLYVLRTRSGTTTTLAETTDYTVTRVDNIDGGDVILTAGATADDVLTVYRDVPEQRLTDFTTSGSFLAKDIDGEIDIMIMMIQEMERSLRRTIHAGFEVTAGSFDLGDSPGWLWWDGSDILLTGAPTSPALPGSWEIIIDEASLVSAPTALTWESPTIDEDYEELLVYVQDVQFAYPLTGASVRMQWRSDAFGWLVDASDYTGETTTEEASHNEVSWTYSAVVDKDSIACTDQFIDDGDTPSFTVRVRKDFEPGNRYQAQVKYFTGKRGEGDGTINTSVALNQFRVFAIEDGSPFGQTDIVGGKVWMWGIK